MPQQIRWEGFISLVIPDGWEMDEDRASKLVKIYRPEGGAGALQLSFARLRGVSDQEGFVRSLLRSLAKDRGGQGVTLSVETITGAPIGHTTFTTTDEYWEAWLLCDGARRVLLTYSCPLAEQGQETIEYAELVASLALL